MMSGGSGGLDTAVRLRDDPSLGEQPNDEADEDEQEEQGACFPKALPPKFGL